jgi:hypothetical protein
MRKGLMIAAVVALAAASGTSTAWAGWGCAARGSSNTWANNFSEDTETEARSNAVDVCERAYAEQHPGKHIVCHIIGCKSGIDTQEQSLAKWPGPNPITLKCGEKFGNKC